MLLSASRTSASAETSGARSSTRRGEARLEPRRVEERGAPDRVATVSRPSRARSAASARCRVALALALGAVEDVGLGDLVEPLADQRLLDQVLDVLDGREDVGEARLDLGDHVGRDRVDARAVDRRPDGADGLGDGRVDAAAVEGGDVPGAFDDAQHGHGDLRKDLDLPTYGEGRRPVNYILCPSRKTAGVGGW